LTGGTAYCANGPGHFGDDGYSYEIWMDSGTNNCGIMYGVDAAFRAEWDLGDSGDFLARAGLDFGSTQPHNEIGTISADYAFIKPDDNGFSWVAVYGWTFEPLMEYYIVEDWSVFRPATDYEHLGTIAVDDGTYDIFYNRRINAASPAGTTDFDQIWSIRQEPRDCGHVSISAHFNEWDRVGLDVGGRLRESMFLVEALNGSGTVDFTVATVQVE
jgi:endo-1,4-beta-xylanase